MNNHEHERDGSIDRLLAAAMPRGATDRSSRCLDEHTLAAWADARLTRAERAAVETHAADCDRCQAMLAAMVAITAASDANASKSSTSPWRFVSWRWLVPATATAAIVLAWILVPTRDRRPAPVEERQVAESARAAPVPQALQERKADAPAPTGPANRANRARGDRQLSATPHEAATDNKTVAAPSANALARSADAALEKDRLADQAAPAAKALAIGAAPAVIVSPDPAIRWRIVEGGAVERSADGGASWQTQSTGAAETLTAGASPSPSVCWLVGPRGAVLLSVDGQSWRRLVFPEAIPLVAIRAADDKAATVTTADGRAFVTTDGGQTWAPRPE